MEELESITKMGSDDFRDWIKTKVECIILTKQITKNFTNSNQNFSKPVIMTEDDSLQKLI